VDTLERYGGAVWRPLTGDEALQPTRRTRGFIVHTFVDHPGPTDMAGYFDRSDVSAEATFVLPLEGPPVQIMKATQRVDTQVAGNYWLEAGVPVGYGSVECEDEGDPEHVPFTDSQLDELVGLFGYYHRVHGIPLRWCQTSTDVGFGWHSMFGYVDGIRLEGGIIHNPWTTAQGKICPGRLRISQLVNIVMPRAVEASNQASGATAMTPEQWNVYKADRERQRVHQEVVEDLLARIDQKLTTFRGGSSKRERSIIDRVKGIRERL